MAITKKPDGRWFVDVEPVKGKRHRKHFSKKSEALRFEAHVRSQYTGKQMPWNPAPADNRRLSELLELWYGHHGLHLADPERRKRSLERLIKQLGDPVAKKLSAAAYLNYRKERALAGVSAKTLNNELGYLRAMYNYLWGTDQISYQCPLSKVKPIKVKDRELSFLTLEQCKELFGVIAAQGNCCLFLIVRLCVETGSRWSEAETLKHSQIGKGRVTYTDTKSGRNRTVPITVELEAPCVRIVVASVKPEPDRGRQEGNHGAIQRRTQGGNSQQTSPATQFNGG